MKHKLTLLIIGLSCLLSVNAQTTNFALATELESSGKQAGGVEFTLGGSGTEIKGESLFGLDLSLSVNPFKARPEIWLGVAQGLFWEPSFAGNTDLFADWSWHIWNDTIYLNTGWSGGIMYSDDDEIWRTGPEAYLQYYTSDNAFIYAGLNWDWVSEGDDGLRYSFGIGLSF